MSLNPGRKLAHYEIVEAIGRGGMGEVYRAKDSKLGRDVAIKVLPGEFARDEERLRRFQREAKVLASLNHPNIASIYGLEQSGETHYLVLELVPGETLADRIERGPIPVDEAVPLFSQIAEGLEAAHERGIIHRDLKPANILVSDDGKPKILDFGLAKVFACEASPSALAESPTLTRETAAGVIIGTAHYMSPEQAHGKAIDKRTDVWAFGCCFYETLTGTKAFQGGTVPEILAAIFSSEADLKVLPRETPPRIHRLIARCLTKDQRRRLRDIGDARILFSEPDEDLWIQVPEVQSRRMSATVGWIAAAIMTLVALASYYTNRGWTSESLTGGVKRFAITLTEDASLDLSQSPVAISPDGSRIVYVAAEAGSTRLMTRSMNQISFQEIPGTEGAKNPIFSPDGEWLAFWADGGLRKMPATGGESTFLAEASAMWGASWGDDDHIVFNGGFGQGLSRVSSAGGAVENLTRPDLQEGESVHLLPNVLPGSRQILFNILQSTVTKPSGYRVALYDRDSNETRTLFTGGASPQYIESGHLVSVAESGLFARLFDLETGELGNDIIGPLEEILVYQEAVPYSVSSEGSMVLAPGGLLRDEFHFQWVDRSGNVLSPVADRTFSSDYATLSPTERNLALESWEEDFVHLWMYDLARGTLSRLTHEGNNLNPVFSPDGISVAFASDRTGRWNLYRKNTDGTGSAEPLLDDDAPNGPFSMLPVRSPTDWSSSSDFVVYTAWHKDTSMDLWLIDKSNDENSVLLDSPFSESDGVLSPDERWLAYVSQESGEDQVYVRAFPGMDHKQQVSVNGGNSPNWSTTSDELFYKAGDSVMAVSVNTVGEQVELGMPVELFESTGIQRLGGRNLSTNGHRFIVPVAAQKAPVRELQFVLNWSSELAERLVPTH